ncbi:MAG: phosphatidate cytidylyltransferase [Brooklawnia sp.]|jgi:phosphatidate cytidylyltransferase
MVSDDTSARKRSAGRNLPVAIGSAVVLFAWILGSLLFWHWGFIIFLALAAAFGSREVVRALGRAGLRARLLPIVIGIPIMMLAAHYLAGAAGQVYGVTAILGGLAIMIIACLVARLSGPVQGYMRDAAASVFTIGYVPLLLSTLTLLLAQPDGHLRIILYFLLVPCSDTAAYAVGSLIGKHKMVPHISPGKTWEGTIGAVVLTGLAGALLAPVMIGASWWAGAIIGVLLSMSATIGDLVESMIKRDAGLKDMGSLIPGHGGAMDRLDSLLVAAPMAWLSMLVLVP